jgi:hypothetical protein
MSDERSWFKRFVEDFGKPPEEAPRPLIPAQMRIPVFVSMIAVSFVLLLLLLWLIVIPAIHAQQALQHSGVLAPFSAART